MESKGKGMCIASLVCSLVAFFVCDPLCLVSITAVILGIVGVCGNYEGKGMAIAGICIGAFDLLTEVILAIFTFGISLLF